MEIQANIKMMKSLAVELLFGVYNAVLAVLCCWHSWQSHPKSAPKSDSNQDQSSEHQESFAAIGDSSKMESLSGLSVENFHPESSNAVMVTVEAIETSQLHSGNKHQWEIELQGDNENTLTPPDYSLQQFKAKLNELISENSFLKNRNCVLETNLDNLLTERHLLETDLRTQQEECFKYRVIAEDALLKYSALQASNENEMEELETLLQLSEANVARGKANFQQLQAALTAEHMRTSIHVKEEQKARQALAYRSDEICRLKAQNIRQKIRITEFEAEMDFNCKKPVRKIPKLVVEPEKRDSKLERLKTKISTSMKPALNRLGAIYPSKMSYWFASPVRIFPN